MAFGLQFSVVGMLRLFLFLSLATISVAFSASERTALHCMLTYSEVVQRVAILDGESCSGQCIEESQRLLNSFGPLVHVERVPMRNLDEKALAGFAAVVVPGGITLDYPMVLGQGGQSALRSFVQNGGAFIGTCAGAQLGSDLGLLPIESNYSRGTGPASISLTPSGANLSAEGPGKRTLYYQNGPVMELIHGTDPEAVDVLAYFNTKRRGLDGSIAIVRGNFGKGKVFLLSPHPELSPGNEDLFTSSVIWGLLAKPKD